MIEHIKASSFIKKVKMQAMNLNEGHRLFVLYFIGIFIGTLVINLLGDSYSDKIGIYGKYIASDENVLKYLGVDNSDFFLYCVRKYCAQILIIVILNCSSKRKYINSAICLYKGILLSVLICVATISYGAGGLLVFLISIFPHYLLYVPMFLYTMYLAININRYIRNKKCIKWLLKGCIIECILVTGTSFFEAYINLPILINVFA